MKIATVLLCLMLAAQSAFAQPLEGWRGSDLYDDSLDLYHHGQLVGSLHVDGRWLPAGARTPVLLDKHFARICKSNFGMNWRGAPTREKLTINGVETPKREAIHAIEAPILDPTPAPSVPDDAKLPRITVISPDAGQRNTVLSDLAKNPDIQGKYVVQGYSPTDWQVQGLGYVAAGQPTIYVQSASGQVLHRQSDYADGPSGLAAALRKLDPSYDPNKDSDLRKSEPDSTDGVSWGVVGLSGVLLAAGMALAKSRM